MAEVTAGMLTGSFGAAFDGTERDDAATETEVNGEPLERVGAFDIMLRCFPTE